jgi:hypothetical protein
VTSVQILLAVYRRLLEEHFGERLVPATLFGSYARGDARADSDVDVAIVLDRIDSPAERMLPMELMGDLIVSHASSRPGHSGPRPRHSGFRLGHV